MDLLLLPSKLWIISYSVLVEWLGNYLICVLAAYYLCHKGGWATFWLGLPRAKNWLLNFKFWRALQTPAFPQIGS